MNQSVRRPTTMPMIAALRESIVSMFMPPISANATEVTVPIERFVFIFKILQKS